MPKKNSGTFTYPGGKTTLAPWIIDHFPAHECYVEPFGGSASVIYNKPKSNIEVFNDLQSDVVHFFRVARDRPKELVEWLRMTPYSREEHDRFSDYFENRPDDTIERAGQFFFLLQSSYGGDITAPSFKTARTKGNTAHNMAEKYFNSVDNIRNIASRFDSVVIEEMDYRDVTEKYDGEDTLFYFDPPYVTDSTHYLEDDFSHSEFVGLLGGLDGKWIVSYDELPDGLEDNYIVTRDRTWTISTGKESQGTEKLVMNYDHEQEPTFSDTAQMTLTDGGFND